MMSIVARRRASPTARGRCRADVVAEGKTAAERFVLEWRGELDPKAVRAIDTYWICTAEHGLNASTFTARVVASTGADAAPRSRPRSARSRARSTAARRRTSCRCSRRSSESGDAEKWVTDALARGKRIMGFGHRVYRAEDPRSRVLKRVAKELGSPRVEVAERARAGRAPRRSRRRARPLVDERRVLVGASSSTSPRCRRTSRPRCSRARAPPAGRRTSSSRSARGSSSARRRSYVGPGARSLQEV